MDKLWWVNILYQDRQTYGQVMVGKYFIYIPVSLYKCLREEIHYGFVTYSPLSSIVLISAEHPCVDTPLAASRGVIKVPLSLYVVCLTMVSSTTLTMNIPCGEQHQQNRSCDHPGSQV